MFILLNISGNSCTVLDTEDFSVDIVTKKFCKDCLNRGIDIKGVHRKGSVVVFEPKQGVLPKKFSTVSPTTRASLLSLQMRGLNVLTAQNIYTGYK